MRPAHFRSLYGNICRHMENGLVRRVGDGGTLKEQIGVLHTDRALLERLRAQSLRTAQEITWTAAGIKLLQVYARPLPDRIGALSAAQRRLTPPQTRSYTAWPTRFCALSVMGRVGRTALFRYCYAKQELIHIGLTVSMPCPTVSFVVPCYNLAHLLPECIKSLVSQTYSDFEILIMDDCSPDNTAGVARSFEDDRIRLIRHESNIGHLRNYNAGINLSRGKYVWLISADDYLRRPYILQRYVELMENHPHVGYTFCPGVRVRKGKEAGVVGYYGKRDRVVKGHVVLKTLLEYNLVVAASGMVRRECYQEISLFPLNAMWAGFPVDMGWLGDWYLWCIFALRFDVGYFAEPMVCYREHDLSMTSRVTRTESIETCAGADIGMLWMIRQKANDSGLCRVSKDCLRAIANEYGRQGASKRYRASTYSMSISHFEKSLCRSTESEKERNWIRARFFDGVGDKCWRRGDLSSAKHFYLASLRKDPRRMKVYAKLLLLVLGKPGGYLRRLVRYFRSTATDVVPDEP
jgi:hypothetical protein